MNDDQRRQVGRLNRAGRPAGARNRFTTRYIDDVAALWEEKGPDVLRQMAIETPSKFAELCSRLIPANVAITLEKPAIQGLSDEDLDMFSAIARSIKNVFSEAGRERPKDGEGMRALIEAALRAYLAKTIEGEVIAGGTEGKNNDE